MQKVLRNFEIIFLLALIALTAIIWQAAFYFGERQNLLITFFDVGQGDSIWVEVPNGNQVLIDGGPNDRVLAKLGGVMPFWDRKIDVLILTHPDADHLNGLLEVLKRYEVSLVLETGVLHTTPQYREWRELLEKKSIKVVNAELGQRVLLGRGVLIDVLAPAEGYAGKETRKINNTSVVSRLTHGENSFLFTGDIEKLVERRLLFELPEFLDSDILKVPHHGSKTSSSEEFLAAVSPEVAVIQVGRSNRYGHPTQEVLERLAAASARIFRNDTGGDITFISDGLIIRKK